jgi:hypothetical protein
MGNTSNSGFEENTASYAARATILKASLAIITRWRPSDALLPFAPAADTCARPIVESNIWIKMRRWAHRGEHIEERLEGATFAQPFEPLPDGIPVPVFLGQRAPTHVLDREKMQDFQKATVICRLAPPARRACAEYHQCVPPVLVAHPRGHRSWPENQLLSSFAQTNHTLAEASNLTTLAKSTAADSQVDTECRSIVATSRSLMADDERLKAAFTSEVSGLTNSG